uniref:Cyclin-dependent kinase 5 activator n=1 Tax=Mesocestoides corti TaxID=53468 RepID=A0A5K3EU42_MESCO
MGTTHSQHSSSVRVSPVCGYSKHLVNTRINPTIHSEGPSTEIVHVTTGSEPHLAGLSVRSTHRQAESNLNSRQNSRRKDFGLKSEAGRLSANGVLFDPGLMENGTWTRSTSKKKLRPRALKQTSHNSTNSSYIADCSPDRNSAWQDDFSSSGHTAYIAVNEHRLRLGLSRLSSIDATRSANGHVNAPQSPSQWDLHRYGDKRSDLSGLDHVPSRLAHRRHLSELCLHLDELNNTNSNGNHIRIRPRSPHKSHPPSAHNYAPAFDFGAQTAHVEPLFRMATTTTSIYTSKSMIESPSCQATPAQSVHCANQLIASNFLRSPLGSEVDLISRGNDNCDDTLDNYHDYANLPQSRTRSFKLQRQQPAMATKLKTEGAYEDNGRIPLPSRRLSKSRWRFMSRGKNLTKSISCYALKFFGQQNRTYDVPDPQMVSGNQCAPPATGLPPPQRQPTLAVVKRDTSNQVSEELGQNLQRVLRLELSENTDNAPRLSHIVSLQAKMNRSLSAFGNQDTTSELSHATRRATYHQPRDGFRRSKLQLLQTTSTKELLHCLSIFILQHCDNLCGLHTVDSPLYPEEIASWIRDIDRALIQQGWTDVPFLSPANVVFLFIMIKGFVDSSITCSRELHSIVMVCLYLSYGYMGNEISYPLKPFLNSEILYSMLHENDPQKFRIINAADPLSSKNPKVINRYRDAFWETCVRVLKCKSKDMLQLNSDAIFFTQSVAELRSYASSSELKPPSAT